MKASKDGEDSFEATAAHVHEDILVIRELADAKALSAREIKLRAACLRRLLVDGGGLLPRMAARMEIELLLPSTDSSALETQADWGNVPLYYVGMEGAPYVSSGVMQKPLPQGTVMPYDSSEKPILVSLPEFLKQITLYYNGISITKANVIDYVSNKAGGVHFDRKQSKEFTAQKLNALDRLRGAFKLKRAEDGTDHVEMNHDYLFKPKLPEEFIMRSDALDFVLSAFVSIAISISESESVLKLEAAIEDYLKD